MINANKEKINSFFQGSIQYIVPFFQRSYVWVEENYQTFLDHILGIYKDNKELPQPTKEHFIGTIITKQKLAQTLGEQKLDLIDGQQRLTTISIFLKALHDTSTGELPNLKQSIERMLKFQDTRGNIFYRIEHSLIDKEYFQIIIDSKKVSDVKKYKNKENRIISAYLFFANELKDLNDFEREGILNTVLFSVPVISMILSAEDDEQEIFDTINSLGVRLTTAELLKNYIFKEISLQSDYNRLWYEIFEKDEDLISFWNKDKTAGRIIRTNIEVLLYCYLIIKTGKEVKLEKLFKEYKIWLTDKSSEEKKSFLEELKVYAELYFTFPNGIDLNEFEFIEHEKRFFHVIENLEITTAYPLILYIYKNVGDAAERERLVCLLESYLVRRNICRFTTKNYNNLFISIINKLKENVEMNFSTLKEVLNSYTEVSNKFPSREEFQIGFTNSHLTNYNAREILYCIALLQKSNNYSDVRKLSFNSFSVEHIMPKKWEENWNNALNEDQKTARNHWISTLGNLTLVTKQLNSKMRNSAWESKKVVLRENSSLQITIKYLDTHWNEIEIQTRAEQLFNDAEKIWKKDF